MDSKWADAFVAEALRLKARVILVMEVFHVRSLTCKRSIKRKPEKQGAPAAEATRLKVQRGHTDVRLLNSKGAPVSHKHYACKYRKGAYRRTPVGQLMGRCFCRRSNTLENAEMHTDVRLLDNTWADALSQK